MSRQLSCQSTVAAPVSTQKDSRNVKLTYPSKIVLVDQG